MTNSPSLNLNKRDTSRQKAITGAITRTQNRIKHEIARHRKRKSRNSAPSPVSRPEGHVPVPCGVCVCVLVCAPAPLSKYVGYCVCLCKGREEVIYAYLKAVPTCGHFLCASTGVSVRANMCIYSVFLCLRASASR